MIAPIRRRRHDGRQPCLRLCQPVLRSPSAGVRPGQVCREPSRLRLQLEGVSDSLSSYTHGLTDLNRAPPYTHFLSFIDKLGLT